MADDQNAPPDVMMVERRDEALPRLSRVRRVLRPLPLFLLRPDRHLVEERREAVHVPEQIRIQGLFFGERDDPTLGASGNRAGPVKSSVWFGSVWDDAVL